jgi:hypothetical protein
MLDLGCLGRNQERKPPSSQHYTPEESEVSPFEFAINGRK